MYILDHYLKAPTILFSLTRSGTTATYRLGEIIFDNEGPMVGFRAFRQKISGGDYKRARGVYIDVRDYDGDPAPVAYGNAWVKGFQSCGRDNFQVVPTGDCTFAAVPNTADAATAEVFRGTTTGICGKGPAESACALVVNATDTGMDIPSAFTALVNAGRRTDEYLESVAYYLRRAFIAPRLRNEPALRSISINDNLGNVVTMSLPTRLSTMKVVNRGESAREALFRARTHHDIQAAQRDFNIVRELRSIVDQSSATMDVSWSLACIPKGWEAYDISAFATFVRQLKL